MSNQQDRIHETELQKQIKVERRKDFGQKLLIVLGVITFFILLYLSIFRSNTFIYISNIVVFVANVIGIKKYLEKEQ